MNKKIISVLFFIALFISSELGQTTTKPTEKLKRITAEKIIDNYINAIGGKESLLKVKDRTTFLRGDIMGKFVSITIYQKAPDKMRQIIEAGQFNQNIYFDGKEGIMTAGGKTFDIKGAEYESLKYESSLYLLVELDSLGIKLKYEGIDTINGMLAYKVEMIFPSGAKWTQYYDTNNWLKIKESKKVVLPQGTFTRDTYFSDYRDVDGVKYPFSVEQQLGNQRVDYVVSSIKTNSNLNDDLFTIK